MTRLVVILAFAIGPVWLDAQGGGPAAASRDLATLAGTVYDPLGNPPRTRSSRSSPRADWTHGRRAPMPPAATSSTACPPVATP
jgi:hypothetical protein